ncbi:MAG: 6-phosphogluconolactonase [Pseudomonadota bacterium]
MALKPELIQFASREQMAERLADVVAVHLDRGLARTGQGRLAVSGGSTPAGLYTALGARALDWSHVTAHLVDERWTPTGTPGSNETFINETLRTANASQVSLKGLWRDTPTPADAMAELNETFGADWRPFDVVVLGMGGDGHTASWFPHAKGLDRALNGEDLVVAVEAIESSVTGKHVHRATLSRRALADAAFVCLLITGEEKRVAFENAIASDDIQAAPVRALFESRPDLWCGWAA